MAIKFGALVGFMACSVASMAAAGIKVEPSGGGDEGILVILIVGALMLLANAAANPAPKAPKTGE
jgi:hypothetical protein